MSASDPGKVSRWTEPGTGVKQYRELTLGNMAKQEASAVAITGGSVLGATLAGNVQEISEAGAISLDANHVKITGPGSSTYAVTLAAPSRGGQILVIEMVSTTDSNAVTLDISSNVVGGTASSSASWDAAGEALVLISTSTEWIVLAEQDVTLS